MTGKWRYLTIPCRGVKNCSYILTGSVGKITSPFLTKAEPERADIPESEPLRSECEHFPECIAAGQIPRTDGREGLRVLEVLNAGQRSE